LPLAGAFRETAFRAGRRFSRTGKTSITKTAPQNCTFVLAGLLRAPIPDIDARMAVYTEVNDDELASWLARYDLGALLACKGIAEGVENSNFLLHMEAGYFILTLYEKRVQEGDLPFFLGLLEHLAARGVTCPQPVRARTGEILGRLAGRPAVIVTFLDGMSVKRPRTAHCEGLGEALAHLHAAGASFAMQRPNALSLDAWGDLFMACESRADRVFPGLSGLIARELLFLRDCWPQRLPEGIIHGDLFPDNVFFLGERISGLIDFYFACNDFLAFDLAICLNAWCFETDGSFNVTRGAALLDGYRRVRALEPEEIAALPVLARGAALRFLLTRLIDWLDRPPAALVHPKDPLEYMRKLRFHQQAGNARDYGLRT